MYMHLCVCATAAVSFQQAKGCFPVLAGPILFLASDAASFISGAHIPICAASQVQLELEDPNVFHANKK